MVLWNKFSSRLFTQKDSGDEGKHENLLQAIKLLSSSGKKKYVYLRVRSKYRASINLNSENKAVWILVVQRPTS